MFHQVKLKLTESRSMVRLITDLWSATEFTAKFQIKHFKKASTVQWSEISIVTNLWITAKFTDKVLCYSQVAFANS